MVPAGDAVGQLLSYFLRGCFCIGLLAAAGAAVAAQPGDSPEAPGAGSDILNLNLEQLSKTAVLVPALDTVVSTVNREESTVGRTAAAVFVITPEMIRRSGARNVPEALRMAPGVEVAQINASIWAISIRGFNGRFANKLLVQIDGRVVYNQLFGGVFWDVQQVVLEDVERIEVIRGPGGTVWGANAVNGVINVITKPASQTQGALISGGGGNVERGFSTVRYGGQVGPDFSWRVYGQQFERAANFSPDGAFDDARQGLGGFRTDWTPTCEDTVTLQGDMYNGTSGSSGIFAIPTPPFDELLTSGENVRGGNVLFRWGRKLDEQTDWKLQTYYDRTERHTPVFIDNQDTVDVDYQLRFPVCDWNDVICGCGYRRITNQGNQGFFYTLEPQQITTNLYSCFVQDEMTLVPDRWCFTAGSKFEHNDFTGVEIQPTVRLLFTPTKRETYWGAISRAVHTPTLADENSITTIHAAPANVPVFGQFQPNNDLESESVVAYELGYRAQPVNSFSWDIAVYFNDYSDISATIPGAPVTIPPGFLIFPATPQNVLAGEGYGTELAVTWDVNERWKLYGAYTFLRLQLHGSGVSNAETDEGSSPHNIFYVRSSWDLANDWDFDLIARYMDNLEGLDVPHYFTMDARLAWRPTCHFEAALVGQNLLDSHHPEFVESVGTVQATEVRRGVYAVVTWTR